MKRTLKTTVVVGILSVHVACGEAEFASRTWGSGFFGGSSELTDDDDAGLDPAIDPGSQDAIGIDPEGTPECIDRDPEVSGVIDFESLPGAVGDHANAFVGDEYAQTHGVIFLSSGNHMPIIRRTARAGEPQLPASEEAWMCILCNGSPSRNRLRDQDAEERVGRYVLSSTAAAEHEPASLTVQYLFPVARFAFDLIDVDGSESWDVVPFDADGLPITSLVQTVSYKGYLTRKTGNGTPTRVEVLAPSGRAEIHGFTISGSKATMLRFGFALDNFDTGVPTCSDEQGE